MLNLREFEKFKIDGSTIIGGAVHSSLMVTDTGIYFERVYEDGNYYYYDLVGCPVSSGHACGEAG